VLAENIIGELRRTIAGVSRDSGATNTSGDPLASSYNLIRLGTARRSTLSTKGAGISVVLGYRSTLPAALERMAGNAYLGP
jgi:hypothetical protein